MPLADTSLRLLPPYGAWAILIGLVVAVLAAVVLAWLMGPANPVSRRGGLWAIRGAIVLLIVLLLLNPVHVEQTPGPIQRPEIFYLLDTSASMEMGNPRSRWDESLSMIAGADKLAGNSSAIVKRFRFGHRLAAIDGAAQSGASGPPAPTDSDTRLQAALKQISSRFGRTPPVGMVVFSDGRIHDEAGLEQIAAEFARLKIPIHVAPVGDTGKGGDVAIAAVVAPPRVRKFTEVEVQVFLRSFGFDGKRGEVVLSDAGEGAGEGRQLSSLPVTLQSGYQSVSLSFRTDMTTRRLRVSIPPLADEVSDKNNGFDCDVAIDRTKIRVLYVEGSSQPISSVQVGERTQYRGPFSDLKQALTDDEDIECVVLAVPGGVGRLARITEYAQQDGVRSFPTTVAELSAFDAIILSDVAAETFTETQLEWIEEWIRERGGGLCMVGGEHSFASGGWDQTRLAGMLPVEMLPGGADWVPDETLRVAPLLPPSPHPVWKLVADEKLNRDVLSDFPGVVGINRWASARPNLTTILATTDVAGVPQAIETPGYSVRRFTSAVQSLLSPSADETGPGGAESLPAIVAGRYSRGRTMALAFPITSPYADEMVQKWGVGDNRYYSKFCRNLVYWLTENSAIGRRRLVASADKRFYRPGETITVQAATYDESASPTKNYRVTAMVEPHSGAAAAVDSDLSPLKWPTGMIREGGDSGPLIYWGEEFELPLGGQDPPLHSIQLPLSESLSSGASSQSMRIELTAYEDLTQVDSTSLDIQILHDPFEQQNPFPNHELLGRVASSSQGKVLKTADDLAAVLENVPVSVGAPVVKRSPVWSKWWVLTLFLVLLTVEWCWRRRLGLA